MMKLKEIWEQMLNDKIVYTIGRGWDYTYQEHVGSITYGNLGKRRTQCSLTDCLEDGIRTHHVWGQYVQQLRKVVAPLDTTQKTVVVVDAGATMSMKTKILEVMDAIMRHLRDMKILEVTHAIMRHSISMEMKILEVMRAAMFHSAIMAIE